MASRNVAYTHHIKNEVEKTPEEYLPTLLQIIRLFRQSLTLKPASESFEQGMREALAGETRPIADLWNGIDAR